MYKEVDLSQVRRKMRHKGSGTVHMHPPDLERVNGEARRCSPQNGDPVWVETVSLVTSDKVKDVSLAVSD